MHDNRTQPEPTAAAQRAVDYGRRQAARAVDTPPVPKGPPGYTIVRRIHQGGQGTVYEALHNATGRRIAIKIMHAGIGRSVYNEARFQREIEILTELRHPHIVTLLDGGITPSHHHFLVMDFVDGLPLDAWIRNHEPGVRATVELFSKICMAIAAAHLRGVVHRDLKPSNIRVDHNGQPRVLDFGLAKMSGAQAHGNVTASGQFIGSLPWATPEQALGRPELIDVRTDVYALGLVLFNMLTDDAPYPVDGAVRDVLNTVLETPPAHAGSVRHGVSADLDTIIMKCLAKEPDRRYLSAGELAADIACYLNGEAIAARRDSTLYVVKKLVSRHRWLTAASVGLVVLSIITAATTSILLERATGFLERAEKAEGDARAMAGLAAQRASHALDTVRLLVDEVSKELKHKPQTSAVRRRILDGAYMQLDKLAREETDNPVFWRERARAHAGMGEIAMDFSEYDRAKRQFGAAAELRQRLVETENCGPDDEADLSISLVQLGDVLAHENNEIDRLDLYERALAIDEDLVARFPDNNNFLDNLVWSYNRIGAYYHGMGRVADSRPYHERQLALAEQLTEREPDTALRWFDLSIAHEKLVGVCILENDAEAVTRHCGQSVDSMQRCLEIEPENQFYLRRASGVFIGAAKIRGGDARIELTGLALGLTERLVMNDPDHPENRIAHGSTCAHIAARAAYSDPAEAVRFYRSAIRSFEHCLSVAPNRERCYAGLFHGLNGVADVLEPAGGAPYQQALTDVLDFLRNALDEGRISAEILRIICQVTIHLRIEDPDEMLELLDEVVAAHGLIDNPQHLALLSQAYGAVGRCDLAVPLARQVLSELDASSVVHRNSLEDLLQHCAATKSAHTSTRQ